MEGKNTSRFSTLRVFKLAGGGKPPPPPPKDAYNITPYMANAASTSQLTLNTISGSTQDLALTPSTSHTRSPNSDDARFLNPQQSPRSPHSTRSVSPTRAPTGSAFKKGFSKLSSLGKRSAPSRAQTADSIHEEPPPEEGISGPWNFQHNVHVNGDLKGLPPSWSASLQEAGFSEEEIAALRNRRNPLQLSAPFAQPSVSAPATTLVTPKPRNDSLRRSNGPSRSATTPSAATAALNLVRRPPSPMSSASASPVEEAPRSLSQRAQPPAPLSFRVVNDDPDPDPDPASLISPPPAYGAPTPSFVPRRGSMEKPRVPESAEAAAAQREPEPEPELEPEPEGEPSHSPQQNTPPNEDYAPPPEESSQEVPPEDPPEDRSPSPEPAPLAARATALPPRLSLHTDQDDDWADMFSFLPSAKRSSIQSRRRSKRFVTGPVLTFEASELEDIQAEPEPEGQDEGAPEPKPASPLHTDTSPTVSTTVVAPASRETVYSPLWQEVRALVGGPSPSSFAAKQQERVPVVEEEQEPELGIAPAPLEDGSLPSELPNSYTSPPSTHTSLAPPPSVLRSRFSDEPAVVSRFSDVTSFQGDDPSRYSEAQFLDSPVSRFSDPRFSNAPVSRFSDSPSERAALPPSRFSDVSDVRYLDASSSRFSDVSDMSRFSGWSTTGHPPSTLFAPLEAMPESPPLVEEPAHVPPSPVLQRHPSPAPQPAPASAPAPQLQPSPTPQRHPSPAPQRPPPPAPLPPPSRAPPPPPTQTFMYPLGRKSSERDLPPPLPPPKDDPPPPPLEADGVIHSARTATMSHARAVSPPSLARAVSPPALTRATSPPALPLAPQGITLPSRIVEQRRAASGSSSSHSQSSSVSSGVVFLQAPLETGPLSAREEPPRSPMLAYLEEGERSPGLVADASADEEDEDEDEDTVPLARVKEELRPREEANYDEEEHYDEEEDDEDTMPLARLRKQNCEEGMEPSITESPAMYDHHDPLPITPAITVNGATPSPSPLPSPLSPPLSLPELPFVLSPLREYIYLEFDPLTMFHSLQEVAQGQYGSVYAAHTTDADAIVAVKKVPVPPNGTPKIAQLRHELGLMSQARHKHILGSDGLFFDAGEGTLWIRMELMERSLADVLELGEAGLVLEERVIARFASDMLLALAYLYDLGLAHRDVRSDNILIDSDGVLKLADFSNAVHVTRQDPFCSDVVGVHHWQAPEIRQGRYDASLVDVWSLGATCWEMAETVPPFADIEDTRALSDRWPPLSLAETYSPVFHDFLRLCSEPPASRPPASQLLHHPFIQQACPRDDVLHMLQICRQIEEGIQQQDDAA